MQNYYTRFIIVLLFLPETYTPDPEYLLSFKLADLDVDVEIAFIGNTIGVTLASETNTLSIERCQQRVA